jgi:hypothetical protein
MLFGGFVGETTNGMVRIYSSLAMSSYIDIQPEDILHYIEPGEENEPTVFFVPDSARVRVTTVRSKSVEASSLRVGSRRPGGYRCGEDATAKRARLMGGTRGPVRPIGPATEDECFWNAAVRYRECLREGKPEQECWDEYELHAARCEAIFPAPAWYV